MSLCEDGFELYRGVFTHDEMVRVIAELPSLELAATTTQSSPPQIQEKA